MWHFHTYIQCVMIRSVYLLPRKHHFFVLGTSKILWAILKYSVNCCLPWLSLPCYRTLELISPHYAPVPINQSLTVPQKLLFKKDIVHTFQVQFKILLLNINFWQAENVKFKLEMVIWADLKIRLRVVYS